MVTYEIFWSDFSAFYTFDVYVDGNYRESNFFEDKSEGVEWVRDKYPGAEEIE